MGRGHSASYLRDDHLTAGRSRSNEAWKGLSYRVYPVRAGCLMKLTDLDPRWGVDADIVIGGVNRHDPDRHGMGITFDCPHCRTMRLAVFFANPIDGKAPSDDATRLWQRTGESFENLSLSPSIDASKHGHWHGFITNGEIR